MKNSQKLHARSPRKRGRSRREEVTTRVLVVSEGTVTEPEYFERLKEKVRSEFFIQLIVRPKAATESSSGGRHPDPKHVVQECIRLRDEDLNKHSCDNDVAPYALCFAVVDVDSYGKKNKVGSSTLEEALKIANKNGIQVIVSNIKFEVWLLWHLSESVPSTPSVLEDLCRKKRILVRKKHLATDFPIDNYKEACVRADQRQKVHLHKVGSNPSSAMPRFFEELGRVSRGYSA